MPTFSKLKANAAEQTDARATADSPDAKDTNANASVVMAPRQPLGNGKRYPSCSEIAGGQPCLSSL